MKLTNTYRNLWMSSYRHRFDASVLRRCSHAEQLGGLGRSRKLQTRRCDLLAICRRPIRRSNEHSRSDERRRGRGLGSWCPRQGALRIAKMWKGIWNQQLPRARSETTRSIFQLTCEWQALARLLNG